MYFLLCSQTREARVGSPGHCNKVYMKLICKRILVAMQKTQRGIEGVE